MTSVVEVLRTYPSVVAALRDLVNAHRTDDPVDDGAIARLEFAVTEAEQLLDRVTAPSVDAGDGPSAAASSTGAKGDAGSGPTTAGARSPKPASTTSSTTTGGRRRQPSPGAVAGGDAEPVSGETKRCSRCRTVKAVDEFNRNRATKDGLAYECRSCRREMAASRGARRREPSDRADKEPSPVGADVILLPTPRPPATPPMPTKNERVCASCNKTLPRSAFRPKAQGLSTRCFVCAGTENVPAGGPDPLPGEISFAVTLTCSRCDLEQTSKHPPAMDRDAIAETWRRVEQALHDCPGELSAVVGAAGRDRPGESAPVPRRAATANRELVAAVLA